MNKQLIAVTALVFLVTLVFIGHQSVPVRAEQATLNPSQTIEPFEEIFPGVYLYWYWWNSTFTDQSVPNEPEEPTDEMEPLSITAPAPLDGGDEPGNHEEESMYYEVKDIYDNTYYILELNNYSATSVESFSNLLVSIILDPDGTYVTYLASQLLDEFEEDDFWSILYVDDPSALSGDEVIVFSSFFFIDSNYSYYYSANYTWYDEEMNEVDPSTVIPNLDPEYEWASSLVGSITISDSWVYKGFGYDVNELVVNANQTHWMEHFFDGMSIFEDRNNNGIMDLVFDTVQYDFNNDGIVDWSYQVLNITESEIMYSFYSDTATIGHVTTPFVNDAGQIEWGMEVKDITGQFWPVAPINPLLLEDDDNDSSWGNEAIGTPINASISSLSMTYRFEVTDTAAILKIDQYVGDFTDPATGESIPEIQGLGLTLDYWSAFSTSNLSLTSSDDHDEYEYEIEYPGDFEYEDDEEYAEIVPTGELAINIDNITLAEIEYGGTYLWGYDDNTYDVGTIISPAYFSILPFEEESEGELELAFDRPLGTFYYSSCYANWSGYSITHDPVFVAYPAHAPGSVSRSIDTLFTASSVLAIGGVIATIVVVSRIITLRRRP